MVEDKDLSLELPAATRVHGRRYHHHTLEEMIWFILKHIEHSNLRPRQSRCRQEHALMELYFFSLVKTDAIRKRRILSCIDLTLVALRFFN